MQASFSFLAFFTTVALYYVAAGADAEEQITSNLATMCHMACLKNYNTFGVCDCNGNDTAEKIRFLRMLLLSKSNAGLNKYVSDNDKGNDYLDHKEKRRWLSLNDDFTEEKDSVVVPNLWGGDAAAKNPFRYGRK